MLNKNVQIVVTIGPKEDQSGSFSGNTVDLYSKLNPVPD
jgi:hypothetical protein